jgi:hypothetical protein
LIGTYNVIEFAQQLSVQEQISSRGELICHSIEEDFRAVVLVLLGGALLALDGQKAQFEHVDAVAEEDCFAAWLDVSMQIRL